MLSEKNLLFCNIAIDMNFITATAVEKALQEQKELPVRIKIGEFLVQQGYIFPWDVEEILARQSKLKKQFLLERCIAAHNKNIKYNNESIFTPINLEGFIKAKLNNKIKILLDDASELDLEKIYKKSVSQITLCDQLSNLLNEARNAGASDLHLSSDLPPFMRKNKQIVYTKKPALTVTDCENLIFNSINEDLKKKLIKNKSLDICLTGENNERYRTSFYKQIKGWDAVFRIIPNKIKSFEELRLPPCIKKLTEYHHGLILVGGPSNSGKTTTLAAMIDLINTQRTDHIISIEEPIEYVHIPKNCQITQRELREHTLSFANALKGALREDPDIIMIGEMRDRETMAMAISASETGHLVLGTMPTSSAARTISAVVDFFPSDQQGQIQSMISESLRGIICQQLLPSKNGDSLELALEVLLFDPAISAIVRQNQLHQLASMIQTGKSRGMCLMDESIMELFKQNKISKETAFAFSEDKTKLQ